MGQISWSVVAVMAGIVACVALITTCHQRNTRMFVEGGYCETKLAGSGETLWVRCDNLHRE